MVETIFTDIPNINAMKIRFEPHVYNRSYFQPCEQFRWREHMKMDKTEEVCHFAKLYHNLKCRDSIARNAHDREQATKELEITTEGWWIPQKNDFSAIWRSEGWVETDLNAIWEVDGHLNAIWRVRGLGWGSFSCKLRSP